MRTIMVAGGLLALVGVVSTALVLGSGDEAKEGRGGAGGRAEGGDRSEPDERGKRGERGERGERGDASEVEELERRVARLELEVKALRGRPMGTTGGRDLRDGDGGVEGVPIAAEIEQQVQSIIAEEREQEDAARRVRRSERFAEMREDALAELAARVELPEAQREAIGALWATEAETMMAMLDAMREDDAPMREIRAQMDKAREETDAEAHKLLGDDAYEQYLELRPGPGRGFGGGGGPR